MVSHSWTTATRGKRARSSSTRGSLKLARVLAIRQRVPRGGRERQQRQAQRARQPQTQIGTPPSSWSTRSRGGGPALAGAALSEAATACISATVRASG